jgi:hypothetical protein
MHAITHGIDAQSKLLSAPELESEPGTEKYMHSIFGSPNLIPDLFV